VKHREIEANGISLHFVEAGDGPAVVFCHGFPGIWSCWKAQNNAHTDQTARSRYSQPVRLLNVEHVGSSGSAHRARRPGQFVAMLGFAATGKTFSRSPAGERKHR
jgi:pimeloyl-ACP methyl ester carboxylesterase